MRNRRVLTAVVSLCMSVNLPAQSKFVEHSTDVLCLAPAATGLVKAITENDRKGIVQLALSTATGIAVNYGLNACIKKDAPEMPLNPGWSDHHTFPSTHTMAAFTGSTFLMKRYGWKWGAPAYAVSAYVAWGRVHTGHHDWWDVLGGALAGAGSAFLYTRPFLKEADLTLTPAVFGNEGGGMYLSVNF